MTRRYASELQPVLGPDKDIPAPDIGTDEQTMAWIMDTYSVNAGYTVPGVVTGKPRQHRRLTGPVDGDVARRGPGRSGRAGAR